MSGLKLTPHAKAQLFRFARVSGLAFLTALPATGGRVSWASLFALAAGAVETGLRELAPTVPLPFVLAQPARPTEVPPGGDVGAKST